ncbi:MAG: class I SAM-dependent methyltransferase [Candidatus Woesearchaeota archaeon]
MPLTSRKRLEAVSHILNVFDLEKDYKTKRNRERLAKILDLVTGNSVLEVGCATGYILNYVASKKNIQESVGVDLNDGRLWVAKKKYPNSKFYKADLLSLPFSDKSFDTVLLPEILEHISQPKKALDEAIRIAKREVIITLPNASKENYDKSLVEISEHKWYPTEEKVKSLLGNKKHEVHFTSNQDFMIIKIFV